MLAEWRGPGGHGQGGWGWGRVLEKEVSPLPLHPFYKHLRKWAYHTLLYILVTVSEKFWSLILRVRYLWVKGEPAFGDVMCMMYLILEPKATWRVGRAAAAPGYRWTVYGTCLLEYLEHSECLWNVYWMDKGVSHSRSTACYWFTLLLSDVSTGVLPQGKLFCLLISYRLKYGMNSR